MRLFISVNFDEEVRRKLFRLQEAVKAQASRGSFSLPENFHLTLAFLGETEEKRLPVIRGIIEVIRGGPFDLSFTRSGCFTHSRKELWWIGVEDKGKGLSSLLDIRRQLREGLKAAELVFDDRPFSAHVTLGREIRHEKPLSFPGVDITVPVRSISLMKSEHIERRLVYTELFVRPL
ncbi:MAG: RNA 2',3'-cyclic phosphodiesterase [Treponema sp.]|jgi:2'-5' RNA ligase|nr:RNA 2',3'-cyclic phosphodiesterase [Treponema sp.]